jgi:hypothetical protein
MMDSYSEEGMSWRALLARVQLIVRRRELEAAMARAAARGDEERRAELYLQLESVVLALVFLDFPAGRGVRREERADTIN